MSDGLDPVAIAELAAIRERLFVAIGQRLTVSGHCKSYEGQFSIVLPHYFEQGVREQWSVNLDLYLIGPSRHYSWSAPDLRGAVRKAAREISKWLDSHDEWWAAHGPHVREGMCDECDQSYREYEA